MTHWKTFSGLAATSTILMTTTALADVTSAEVWSDWRAYLETSGYTVNVDSEAQSGSTLRISGVSATQTQDNVSMAMNLGELNFVEQGDGTVSIVMEPQYTYDIQSAGSDDFAMSLNVSQENAEIIASGSADETNYAFNLPSIVVTADELTADGDKMTIGLNVTLTDYAGNYLVKSGDVTDFSGTANMGAMTALANIEEPDGPGTIAVNFNAAGFTGTLAMASPPMVNYADEFQAALRDGFAMQSDVTFGAMDLSIDAAGMDEAFSLNADIASGSYDITLNKDTMSFSELLNSVNFVVSGAQIPFPQIQVQADELGFNLGMPVSKGTEPSDVAFGTRIVGLTVTDAIWGMFDPSATLPRDPASIVLDLTGQANWLFDIFDQEEAMKSQMSGDQPAELHELTINELLVSAVGAELNGSGSFTFDNADTTTFDGIPRPTGAVDLSLSGANGLLDRLGQMGLLPVEEAMGFRMMMGMFTVPGEGEDNLNSRIEVNEQGHVSANGQRLR
ncbi:DUF2125 domain-containing protein [Cochlodiniinecator piscidefendens]|uniref:DUF2125 domain-containing protein n=1 Tax=Cochlodiniinecator piscidefendens TaxID=2715756 RepID=UPI00197C03A1|nr:DUF2125 domain-containing protein [Cochlodiniinecator piscidefendens]